MSTVLSVVGIVVLITGLMAWLSRPTGAGPTPRGERDIAFVESFTLFLISGAAWILLALIHWKPWRLLGIALFAIAFASPAQAAPRIANPQECRNYGDMAIVARALKLDGIAAPKALSIFTQIYVGMKPGDQDHPIVRELATAIIRAAYREKKLNAGEFHSWFVIECMKREGNMDGILGVES